MTFTVPAPSVTRITSPARSTLAIRARRGLMLVLATAGSVLGCTPRAHSLVGSPVPAERIPSTRLPPGHRRVIFRWSYGDQSITARGEGVARLAPPDSARLDFFLDGGMGGGYAIVLGNEIWTPADDRARRYLPPPALLWAALGRVAVDPAPDTTARVDGDVLRADIGRDPSWRAAFRGDRLIRLERIVKGRIVEWVAHTSDDDVRYENERARRTLTLRITRTEDSKEFDADIWRR